MECQPQIHNLIDASASCDEFASIGCNLHGGLLLGIPVDGCLLEEVPVKEWPVSMS